MRDWIHWLWQQWEWEGDLSPELTREVVRAEEALLGTFTPEQRELYEALEEVRARRDLREQKAIFRASVLLGGGLVIGFCKIQSRHKELPSGLINKFKRAQGQARKPPLCSHICVIFSPDIFAHIQICYSETFVHSKLIAFCFHSKIRTNCRNRDPSILDVLLAF